MANEGWRLWQTELKTPTPEERRLDRTSEPTMMSGYWRINRARTKPDTPMAIWTQDGEPHTIFQFGERFPLNTAKDPARWQSFIEKDWLKSTAISRDEWDRALQAGKFDDGKDAREFTDAEKLDLVPDTPSAEGGNNPVGADLFHAQIEAKIGALTEKARAIGTIDTLDKANAAAEILEPLRGLYKQGESRRKEEVAPFDEGRAKVQAKWSILGSAKSWGETLVASIQKFRDREKARLEAEERKRQDEERRRISDETRARLEAEAAERQRQAEHMGMTEDAPSADDIAAQAEEIAAEAVAEQAAAAAPIEAPRVGTAHGRGVSAIKTKTATIVDAKALALHLVETEDSDFLDYLKKRANAAARAKITLPGCEIDK
jgi:hypothetical protein